MSREVDWGPDRGREVLPATDEWQCARCAKPPEDCECAEGFLIVSQSLYDALIEVIKEVPD